MVTRLAIVNEARKWKDVSWRHEGRTVKGIDCVGLIVMVAKGLGLSEYDFHGYTREPNNADLINHFKENMRQKPIDYPEQGDVVIFCDGRFPFHVGIIGEKYDQLSLIHAFLGRRKVIEEIYTPEWSKLTIACFEFHGLEGL